MVAARTTRTPAGTARRKILDEALRLFGTDGYHGTTIEAVARGAGVAVQTVYFTFGNKRALLKELVDVNVAGDDQPIPTLDREWLRAVLDEPDPQVHLQRQVHAAAAIHKRVAPLLRVMRTTADVDAEVADLWRENQRQRRAVQLRLITSLQRKHPLREGLSVARATDIAYAMLGPEMFQTLVTERGWSVPEWERWSLRSLRDDLLGPPQR